MTSTLKQKADSAKAKVAAVKAARESKVAEVVAPAKAAPAKTSTRRPTLAARLVKVQKEEEAARAKKPVPTVAAAYARKQASEEAAPRRNLRAEREKAQAATEKVVKAAKTKKAAAGDELDLEGMMEATAAAGVPIADQEDALKRLVVMGAQMLEAKERLDKAEEALAVAKEEHRQLEQGDLPDLMREIGMATFKMADGSTFDLVEDIQCGISEERRPEAHGWLRTNGFEAIIKTDFKISFGRDKIKEADKLQKELEKKGIFADRKESVHPQTLKSFIKERLEAGTEIPFEPFAIHPFDKVKHTQPKPARRGKA